MGFKRTPLTSEQFAALASGSMDAAGVLNGLQCVAGMDVLVAEDHPMANEPEGNAYHYVFQRTNDQRYPYLMSGPYRAETRVRHWFEYADLDTYWNL